HPERSEGSPLPAKQARFFASLRMTDSPGRPDCDVLHLEPEEPLFGAAATPVLSQLRWGERAVVHRNRDRHCRGPFRLF
ncbi:MAG: hypothetical protein ACLQNE_44980, partial [Thermoguttaceae bacterium]